MNKILQDKNILEQRNYVLSADSGDYWFGLNANRINDLRTTFGDNFNLIIFGDPEIETDYYIIPFSAIVDLLTESSFYDSDKRWKATIKNHILNWRISRIRRNVAIYYSVPYNMDLSVPAENDYAIENAKREIEIRLKQSKFRKAVLKRFNGTCCISGITEQGLLIASHIVPWADKIDSRLDPANGLCLSVLYDKLFDKGYFSLDEDFNVITTRKYSGLCSKVKDILGNIDKQIILSDLRDSAGYLSYHRANIFESHK